MDDLSLEELIAEAKKRKINLGDDSKKTIDFYTEIGFISKPEQRGTKVKGKTSTELFYPASTIDKLAQIKELKSEGLSLDEIRDSFALEYVQTALLDLMEKADDEKTRHLAQMLSGSKDELENIVLAPLIYLIEGMSPEEAKKLLTLFCGVGFYALLDAQQSLEKFQLNDAKRSLAKAMFYNSIAVLRLARTTGDKNLEKTAVEVYENVVLGPIGRASERVRKKFLKSLNEHLKLDDE